ncbi:membrane-bound lytic murein transglycosylase D [Desulfovibrionales bacterium]
MKKSNLACKLNDLFTTDYTSFCWRAYFRALTIPLLELLMPRTRSKFRSSISVYRALCYIAIYCLMLSACVPKNGPNEPIGKRAFSIRVPLDQKLHRALELSDTESMVLTPQERVALDTSLRIPHRKDAAARMAIKAQLIYFTRTIPDVVRCWLERSGQHILYVQHVFRERSLPEELACLAFIESGYNIKAVSRSGAAGLWQFMPFTGQQYGLAVDSSIDERFDVYRSTQAAADYLIKLYRHFNDWTLVLAAYNAGEGKVSRAIAMTGSREFFHLAENNDYVDSENQLKEETLQYVPRFLAMAKLVRNLDRLGFPAIRPCNQTEFQQLVLRTNTDLRGLAKACGLDWKEFRQMNPSLIGDMSPPNRSTSIILPVRVVAVAQKFLSRPSANLDTLVHVVQARDMANLTRRYQARPREIRNINNSNVNCTHSGQKNIIQQTQNSTYVAVQKSEPQHDPYVLSQSRYTPQSTSAMQSRFSSISNVKNSYPDKKQAQALLAVEELGDLRASHALSLANLRPDAKAPGANVQKGLVVLPAQARVGTIFLTYQVQNGDTIWSIARQFLVSPYDLMQWNGRNDCQILKPGDLIRLTLPGRQVSLNKEYDSSHKRTTEYNAD